MKRSTIAFLTLPALGILLFAAGAMWGAVGFGSYPEGVGYYELLFEQGDVNLWIAHSLMTLGVFSVASAPFVFLLLRVRERRKGKRCAETDG